MNMNTNLLKHQFGDLWCLDIFKHMIRYRTIRKRTLKDLCRVLKKKRGKNCHPLLSNEPILSSHYLFVNRQAWFRGLIRNWIQFRDFVSPARFQIVTRKGIMYEYICTNNNIIHLRLIWKFCKYTFLSLPWH
jgi:hypothetical protein